MLREINEKLHKWKANSLKKALLLTGARQVGKTYSIREFANSEFESFVEINLLEDTNARNLFCQAKSSKEILIYLTAIVNKPLIKGKSLIFLDEVQECPEIITAIKFLVEEGSYSYVLSGSLLGVELKNIRSIPVGYIETLEMFPMNFKEFCIANGIKEDAFDYLEDCFIKRKSLLQAYHDKLLGLFHLYLVVGGMPACVKQFVETNNIAETVALQQDIIRQYKKDISKYDPANKLYIDSIYELIPSELNAQNKRFEANKLKKGIKFDRTENGFLWLTEAGVAIPVYCANEPKFPLMLSRARNQLKLFLSDIGLLAAMYMNGMQIKILQRDLAMNFGGIYENAVAQELRYHGITPYYYKNNRLGELDFIFESDGHIIPLEVKSGKDYKKHSALNHLLGCGSYEIDTAYVLSNFNISVVGKVVYLPIYMTMFLKPHQPLPTFYHPIL